MCIEPPRPADTPSSRAEQLGHHAAGSVAARRARGRASGRSRTGSRRRAARDGADDRRLLADREVQEAADLGLRVHLARALLEAADQHHRLQPFARASARAACASGWPVRSHRGGLPGDAVPGLHTRASTPTPRDARGRCSRGPALARVGAARARRLGARRARGPRGAIGAVRLLGVVPVPTRIVDVVPRSSWSWRVGPVLMDHRVSRGPAAAA